MVRFNSVLVVIRISAKTGSCPLPNDDRSGCRTECSLDHDCDGNFKCCEQTCGRTCVEPVIKGELLIRVPLFKTKVEWSSRPI